MTENKQSSINDQKKTQMKMQKNIFQKKNTLGTIQNWIANSFINCKLKL